MLKKFFPFLVFFSLNASACLRIEGSVSLDGEIWKISNKITQGKNYLLPLGDFIFKYKIEDKQTFTYSIHERRESSLVLITKGDEENIEVGKIREIYAKGEEGHPHSIITIKLINL